MAGHSGMESVLEELLQQALLLADSLALKMVGVKIAEALDHLRLSDPKSMPGED